MFCLNCRLAAPWSPGKAAHEGDAGALEMGFLVAPRVPKDGDFVPAKNGDVSWDYDGKKDWTLRI